MEQTIVDPVQSNAPTAYFQSCNWSTLRTSPRPDEKKNGIEKEIKSLTNFLDALFSLYVFSICIKFIELKILFSALLEKPPPLFST